MFQTMPNYEEYKALYINGTSLIEIEKTYGVNRKKLSKLLKQDGLEIRQNGQKYKYNDDFFEIIDTEEKAYWLGFLYADGNVDNFAVNEIRLGLSIKDKEHVLRFRDTICPELPPRIKSTKLLGEKEFLSYDLTITNKKLVDDIIDKGCMPRKSLILKFPTAEQVPDKLIHHFIRGYFDGDGCITHGYDRRRNKCKIRPYWSLLGTFEFLSEVQEIFSNSIPTYTKVKISQKSGANAFHIQKAGTNQVREIFKYLYKDATIYLERKYQKFIEIYSEELPSSGESR